MTKFSATILAPSRGGLDLDMGETSHVRELSLDRKSWSCYREARDRDDTNTY